MKLTISGYSTALFATWFFIDELSILFDCGDGVSAGLHQKSRKIKHAFISHADRDHLGGLFQFLQLNAKDGLPHIYYPRDSGSFPAIESFSEKFDPHTGNASWHPIATGDAISTKPGILVKAFRNEHIPVPQGVAKSLSYQVFGTKKKLKDEFWSFSGHEIQQLTKEKGKDFITKQVDEHIITYSGDTPIMDYALWDNSNILIHEATFLGSSQDTSISMHENKHSHLEDVIRMVSEISVQKLILSHFSSRYDHDEIDDNIRALCKKYRITIPVYRILPGQMHRDILNETPVND